MRGSGAVSVAFCVLAFLLRGDPALGRPGGPQERISNTFEHAPQLELAQERPRAGDPVLVGTGELRYQKTDLLVPSRGFPFRFTRVYRSFLSYDGPLGKQ